MEVVSLKSDTAIFCCFVKKAKNCLLLNRNLVLGISIYLGSGAILAQLLYELTVLVSFSKCTCQVLAPNVQLSFVC